MRRIALGIAVATAAAMLAACQPREVRVEDAWVRLSSVPGRPAAAYFTVVGGDAARTLLGVGSTAFRRAELHDSMAAGMRLLPSITVPAGEKFAFAPTGRHAMLFEVEPTVRPGATVPLQLTFDDEKSVIVDAVVVGAADPAPS